MKDLKTLLFEADKMFPRSKKPRRLVQRTLDFALSQPDGSDAEKQKAD